MALADKIAFFFKLSDLVEEVSGSLLTNGGSTPFVAGKIGNAASGDGSTQSLYGSLSAANVPATEYHRWCWVNVDHPLDGSSGTPLFSPFAKWNAGGDWIFTIWEDGHIDFSNLNGGVNSTGLLSPNTWHLIHGWWDGTNYNVQIDNGTPDSNAGSTPGTNSSDVSILAQGGGSSNFMPGMVDAAGGSNVAWDAGDYTELWNSGAGYEFSFAPPTVTLSVDETTISENAGVATVTATLSAATTRAAGVDLALSGTATGGGVDYTVDDVSLSIAVGDTTAAATITAVNNGADDGDRTVVVDISSTTNATENGTQQLTITITDDDAGGGGGGVTISMGEIMQGEFKQGQTTYAIEFPLVHSATGLLVTGATPAVKVKAPGAGFVAAAGTPGEIGVGYYSVSPHATDFQTLGPNLFLATAANCLPSLGRFMVVQHSPTIGLPAANPGTPGGLVTATAGSATGAVVVDSAGNVAGDVKKWLGTTVLTPDTAGAPKITIKNGTGTGELSLTAGTVKANGTNGQLLPDAATVNQLLTDTTSLLARLTSARAGYLDHLNIGGPAAAAADIAKLLRVQAQVLPQVLRPDSGSATFTIEVRTFNSNSVAANADSTPTVTATGGVSGSLSGNLAAGSNPATGVYRYTYTLTSAASLEEIRFDITATIGGGPFTASVFSQVAPASTFTATDRTTLGNAATATQLGNSSAQLLAAAWGTGTTANTAMTRDRLLEAACGMLVGICSGAGTITNHFAHAGRSVPNVTITVDNLGNRSAVVFN